MAWTVIPIYDRRKYPIYLCEIKVDDVFKMT